MKQEAVLVFPHQLFEQHPAITHERKIFLIEHPRYFTDFNFHKQKIMLHRASMKVYADHLRAQKHQVTYIDLADATSIPLHIKKYTINKIHVADVVDHKLEKELKKQFGKMLVIHESPAFLSSRDYLEETLGDQNHYLMNSFYIAQRKHLDILITHGKPTGGKWGYDAENRLKMPKDLHVPKAWHPRENKYTKEARTYIEKNFKNNPGSQEDFRWPISHDQAKKSLHDFLENRLALFGPYQDAIDTNHDLMFHSVLSSSLNNGLLTPDYVIWQALAFAKKNHTPLNSLEGFIRQIIGWREFVRGIYLIKGEYQRKQNFFGHKYKLPVSFWNGTTGIYPLDATIKKTLKLAYAHHIERLMVVGNFMLLTRIHPDDAYRWFMELFIDAYDWVMVPNVYGMSQYADGGLMTTKPYFSGSNYIKKMSNYPKGSWCTIWDSLYWGFILDHRSMISKNARLSVLGMYLRKMSPELVKKHMQATRKYLSGFNNA